jgi:hypothetical protein
VAVDDIVATDEDVAIVVDVATNDVGAAAATLVSPPSHGSAAHLSGTLFEFVPPPDWSGATSFVYEISDTVGRTATAAVDVTVRPVADAPVATDDSYATSIGIAVNLGGRGVLANDGDGDGDPLTASLGTPPASGGFVFVFPSGGFFYLPPPLFAGTDTFTYVVSDGTGRSDVGTVTIAVGPLTP